MFPLRNDHTLKLMANDSALRTQNSHLRTVTHRIHNFAAGPAILPVPVLEEIQRDLIALPGVGMSVLEISHRSSTFESILAQAEADIRTLGNIPANYKVLFLQGGPGLQFPLVPVHLLGHGRNGQTGD